MSLVTPVCAVWIVFLMSEVVAVSLVYYLRDFHVWAWDAKRWLYIQHTVGMPVIMLIINAHGMFIFRLFPGCRTEFLKYMHALLHTVVLCVGWYIADIGTQFKNQISIIPTEREYHFHFYLSAVTGVLYFVQWVTAVITVFYLYSTQRTRLFYASYHNWLGIIVFHFGTFASCDNLYFIINTMNEHIAKKNDTTGSVALLLIATYYLLVNIILLNPYFEWPLVSNTYKWGSTV